ncbi:MAG TPA: hypothetical protein VHV99_21500 [Paraburkholderia sp.]|jgi:hypothetical protein|nr:hypothetical protein [Paraburkholderia sp.]
MIKRLTFFALIGVTFQAHACNVTYSTASDSVDKAITEQGWDFKNYDIICEKLRAANAALLVDGQATVLGGKSIAWASVKLREKNLTIFTADYGGKSTQTNDYASIDKADSMLITAINRAVESVDVDKAIKSLAEQRSLVKAAYSK